MPALLISSAMMPGRAAAARQKLHLPAALLPLCSHSMHCSSTCCCCKVLLSLGYFTPIPLLQDSLQPSSSTAGETQSGWPVQHLPPILLQLSLPSTYPSEQPPNARINATWLTSHQVQQLQQHLLDMWNAAAGLPICYTWVDWLQQDSLAYLGISDTLDLSQFAAPGISNTPNQVATTRPDILNSSQPGPEPHSEHDGQHHHAEPCQPCQNQSAEKVLMDLLRFDAAEKLRAFHRGTWTCGICFEQFPGRSCVQASLQCGHVYCQSCMAQQCGLHVKEGSLEFLRCPEPDCKEPLDRQVCINVLSAILALSNGMSPFWCSAQLPGHAQHAGSLGHSTQTVCSGHRSHGLHICSCRCRRW